MQMSHQKMLSRILLMFWRHLLWLLLLLPSFGGSRLDDLFIQQCQFFFLVGTSVSGDPEGCGG
jgi:hypothetical protein